MRISLTTFAFFFGIVAHAAHLAPWHSDGDGTPPGTVESALVGYGFAVASAETGCGIAAGVSVGLHGSDVALAGYYTMVNGVPQDTLTSQGLQAVGIPQDWANGIDAGISMSGTMGVGAAMRTSANRSIVVADDVLSASRQVTENSGSASIQFGGNANQVYHTFRHVDEMGLDRRMVQEAVRNNIGTMSSQIVPGKPFIQIITVDGQKIQYNAYMLSNGTINVGRINGVP